MTWRQLADVSRSPPGTIYQSPSPSPLLSAALTLITPYPSSLSVPTLSLAFPPPLPTPLSAPPAPAHRLPPPRVCSYPLSLTERVNRLRRCDICEHTQACRVTYDDPLAPSSPAFFCQHCFDMLHTDEHGRLLPDSVPSFPYTLAAG